jgi:hypothetical protein
MLINENSRGVFFMLGFVDYLPMYQFNLDMFGISSPRISTKMSFSYADVMSQLATINLVHHVIQDKVIAQLSDK